MTNPILTAILADACNPGQVRGPGDLLSAAAAIDRPMELLSNWDKSHELCDVFIREYGFIQLAYVAGIQPKSADMEKWSALVRWIIDELTAWSPASDPNLRKLSAIFVASAMSRISHAAWKLLPSPFATNQKLVALLQAMLRSCRVTIDAPLNNRSPISTKATVERFTAANTSQDWKEINECLDRSGDFVSASLVQAQATRILLQCGPDDLLSVLSGIDEALTAVSFVDAVNDEEACLALAVACSSPYFEFVALRSAVYQRGHVTTIALGLEALIEKMSADADRWRSLMDIFNRYPVRYPRLQEALGTALANAPLQAIEAYIGAIELHDLAFDDSGRDNVATCLRAFQACASQSQREAMWKLAYDRWSIWDFGRSGPHTHLLEIRVSILDYAIVGYAIECLGSNAAMQVRTDIVSNALDLHQDWYLSSSEMIADWNRSLSRFQPFAHAEHVLANSNEDWLCKTCKYLPTDTQTDYLKLKYRMA